MGDSDNTWSWSCLSAEPHDKPQDSILHYFGCLEFCNRQEHFNSLNEPAQRRIKTELKRVVYLRDVLRSGDAVDARLVQNLDQSMQAWRQSELYLGSHGIEGVKVRRAERGLPNGNTEQFEPGEATKANHPGYHRDSDIKASLIIYDENGDPIQDLDNYGLSGHFPDHRMPVSQLLKRGQREELNPLSQASACPKTCKCISYFHLPANNMSWAEKAITRYFGEEDLKNDRNENSKAQMLLRPQFWRGQQNGGRSAEIHARHSRPLCEVVSSDPEHVDASPGNVVLFMPFLHWETDRQRETIARFLSHEEYQDRQKRKRNERQRKQARVFERRELFKPNLGHSGKEPAGSLHRGKAASLQRLLTPTPGILKTLSQVVDNVPPRILPRPRRKLHLFDSDKYGRVCASTSSELGPLGQILIDAARLYEAMVTYRDKMLIREYLFEDPPLHPRRTLDQACYWTLKTTRARDRDQVVYRGTTPEPPHSIGLHTKEWTCFHEESDEVYQKEVFDESRTAKFCVHCANHVRKVSRILMVDQLWMWILDEKTIITAFPKRYGLNKQDPTGVHIAIRKRLKNLRPGYIKTVFDLALIILEESTSLFFDRTRTEGQQPDVLRIFSEAIGNVNNKQTLSYEHLWDWTKRLAQVASPGAIATDLSGFVAPLLNISTEGGFQREIKDIIDELNIMIHLKLQQLEIIKSFKKQVEQLLTSRFSVGSPPTSPTSFDHADGTPHTRSETKQLYWFQRTSRDLVSAVEGHIAELQGLKHSAESTSVSLDNLLSLRQQQASVVQAWQSVQQAEEAVKQGQAIMIFTVITIIFLPLAFIASIFGMNNKQISGDDAPMTLQQQFRLMCLDWRSTSLTRKVEEKVRDMKLLAKRHKRKRIWSKIQQYREDRILNEVDGERKCQVDEDKQRSTADANYQLNAGVNGVGSPDESTATTTATPNPMRTKIRWALASVRTQ